MSLVRPITRRDIKGPALYGPIRDDLRKRIIELKRPRRVLLYDENGRVLLRANLSNHEPVEIESSPRDQWPLVATKYALVFPDTGTTMDIEIETAMLRRKNFPNDKTFIRPTNPGVKTIEQLDAACGP